MTKAQKSALIAQASGLCQSDHQYASPEYLLASLISLNARIQALEAKAGIQTDSASEDTAAEAEAAAKAKAEADAAAKAKADADAAAAKQAAEVLASAPL